MKIIQYSLGLMLIFSSCVENRKTQAPTPSDSNKHPFEGSWIATSEYNDSDDPQLGSIMIFNNEGICSYAGTPKESLGDDQFVEFVTLSPHSKIEITDAPDAPAYIYKKEILYKNGKRNIQYSIFWLDGTGIRRTTTERDTVALLKEAVGEITRSKLDSLFCIRKK